jgi:hypothetical protein
LLLHPSAGLQLVIKIPVISSLKSGLDSSHTFQSFTYYPNH